MNTARDNKLLSPRSGVIYAIVLFAALLLHSARYLPETSNLFVITLIARLLVALAAGTALAILLGIITKLFQKNFNAWSMPVVALLGAALVASMMSLASIGTVVPDGLTQLYIMH